MRVANAEMVRALRVMTVEQGIDPRRFALLAFGGAGPLHAAAIADELGMTTILCPRASGVLSALGLAAADRRATEQRTVLLAGDALTDDALARRARRARPARRARRSAASARRRSVEVAYDVRYRGQAHELTVRDLDRRRRSTDVRAAFEALHDERYGYRDADTPIEVVTIRATARVPGPGARPRRGRRRRARSARGATVVFAGEEHDAEIVRGEPAPGERIAGPGDLRAARGDARRPARAGAARVDEAGTIVLERDRPEGGR